MTFNSAHALSGLFMCVIILSSIGTLTAFISSITATVESGWDRARNHWTALACFATALIISVTLISGMS